MKRIDAKIVDIAESTLDHYLDSVTRKRYVEDVQKIREICGESEPTDTDFVLIQRLAAVYKPQQRGIVTGLEIQQIKGCLQIERRTVISLRNLRNAVVAMRDLFKEDISDKVSAITHVIDGELLNRGVEI